MQPVAGTFSREFGNVILALIPYTEFVWETVKRACIFTSIRGGTNAETGFRGSICW